MAYQCTDHANIFDMVMPTTSGIIPIKLGDFSSIISTIFTLTLYWTAPPPLLFNATAKP